MLELIVVPVFISVLIITPNTPSQGWLQWTQPFFTIEQCHDAVRNSYFQIEKDVNIALKGKSIKVMEIQCITRHEAVKRNTEFGH